jgi:DNA gyrase/topoisomerase IV subunit B
VHFPKAQPKLSDCRVHGPDSGAELFVVEGDSAAITVAQACDSTFQAVLPMQGKPLNAVRAPDRKVAANPLLMALTDVLGAGWGASFDPQKLRYERVLLLTDPDADGIHCSALLLMFFYRWMRPLLDRGHVMIVRAPFGEVSAREMKSPVLAFSEAQLQSVCRQLRDRGVADFAAQRFRGLASLDRATLERFCIDPASRNAGPISVADAELAMEVFAINGVLSPQQQLL